MHRQSHPVPSSRFVRRERQSGLLRPLLECFEVVSWTRFCAEPLREVKELLQERRRAVVAPCFPDDLIAFEPQIEAQKSATGVLALRDAFQLLCQARFGS